MIPRPQVILLFLVAVASLGLGKPLLFTDFARGSISPARGIQWLAAACINTHASWHHRVSHCLVCLWSRPVLLVASG
jgi:hypothetical protein